jgi:hypothetical protein
MLSKFHRPEFGIRVAFAVLALVPMVGSACIDSFVGQTSKYQVVMGDFDCSFPEDMIFRLEKSPTHEVLPIDPVPFSSQCTATKSGFTCRASGKTVLAGTKYKAVRGPNSCGVVVWPNFKCVEGCKQAGVPAYLKSTPYDCE